MDGTDDSAFPHTGQKPKRKKQKNKKKHAGPQLNHHPRVQWPLDAPYYSVVDEPQPS
jgi:hypothetical protein